MATVLPKQRWMNKSAGIEARVLAVAEGHVMARYKGAMVWVMPVKKFLARFELRATVP